MKLTSITVTFSRTLQVRQYEPATATVTLTASLDDEVDEAGNPTVKIAKGGNDRFHAISAALHKAAAIQVDEQLEAYVRDNK